MFIPLFQKSLMIWIHECEVSRNLGEFDFYGEPFYS